MRNISDIIEKYLKGILHQHPDQIIEIQRNDLADKFQCVPSQINYVISTRFTLEKGYLVESKRGGGGYIRIKKVKLPTEGGLKGHVLNMIGSEIDQTAAEGLVCQLEEAMVISPREAKLIKAAISRDVINVQLPLRDELRAKMLKAMLISLLTE